MLDEFKMWRTCDGQVFSSECAAKEHESAIEDARRRRERMGTCACGTVRDVYAEISCPNPECHRERIALLEKRLREVRALEAKYNAAWLVHNDGTTRSMDAKAAKKWAKIIATECNSFDTRDVLNREIAMYEASKLGAEQDLANALAKKAAAR